MKNLLRSILPRLRNLGPYVLVELLLPGGTLLALLLWVSQQWRPVQPAHSGMNRGAVVAKA